MLELLVAALIQVSVLVSGSAPVTNTDVAATQATTKSTPTTTTNIGGTGWDDRN